VCEERESYLPIRLTASYLCGSVYKNNWMLQCYKFYFYICNCLSLSMHFTVEVWKCPFLYYVGELVNKNNSFKDLNPQELN
jgi:hypothetical protein